MAQRLSPGELAAMLGKPIPVPARTPEEIAAAPLPPPVAPTTQEDFLAMLRGDSVPAQPAPPPTPSLEEQLRASIAATAPLPEPVVVRATPEVVAARDNLTAEELQEVEQAAAVQAVAGELPKYSFVTGPAGSGKTTLVREQALNPSNGITLCATTGIAAINLGEGITTINSLLRYYNTATLRDHYVGGFLMAQLKKLYRSGVMEICIDEISMMDGAQLDLLVQAFDATNAELQAEGASVPLRLRLIGDFAQLPPVKGTFAFQMPCWKLFDAHTTKLTKIHRQANADFLTALGYCRKGSGIQAAEYFAPFCAQTLDYEFSGTTLLGVNAAVDRFNAQRYNRINEPEISMPSEGWGQQRAEWKSYIDGTLKLKKGSLVMMLANQRPDDRDEPGLVYANGDLGTVVDFDTSRWGTPDCPAPWVRLHRNQEVVPVHRVTRQNLIPLETGRRKQLRDAGHPERIKDKYEIIGEITYTPLRLAWATTVHKAQGLTLEHVQVGLQHGFFNTPGMSYVAMSRVRSPNGLRIVANPQTLAMKFAVHPQVRRWLE